MNVVGWVGNHRMPTRWQFICRDGACEGVLIGRPDEA